MKMDEVKSVCDLMNKVFDECTAPLQSLKGIDYFHKHSTVDSLASRIKQGDLVLVAYIKKNIVGVIIIKNKNHISRLFVEVDFQRKGIGKQLLRYYLKNHADDHISQISVNSAPNSVSAYKAMGFKQIGPMNEDDCGIKCIPMIYDNNNFK